MDLMTKSPLAYLSIIDIIKILILSEMMTVKCVKCEYECCTGKPF
ncbi:12729_t:CDS:1, partial [Cetraspora pellucida]